MLMSYVDHIRQETVWDVVVSFHTSDHFVQRSVVNLYSTLKLWKTHFFEKLLLRTLQSAGSQEIPNGLVEDFRTALDILAQAAPTSSVTSIEAGSRIDRADTVILMDEDSSSGGSRHRLTPNSNGNQFERSRTDSSINQGDHTSTNGGTANLQRELSRLRDFIQSAELQRFSVLLLNTVPFVIILLSKTVIDGFYSLLTLLSAFISFHVANSTFLASRREKRYFNLLQSFASSFLFFNFHSFFYGLDSVYLPLTFMSHLIKPVTFFSTLHVVLVNDFAVKIITVELKAGLTLLPVKIIGDRRLRRLFQWLEYTSQFYRYILPIPHWMRYLSYSQFSTPLTSFSDHFFAVIYILYKACLIHIIGKRWFESTKRIFRLASIGFNISMKSEESMQCTICFNDLCSPMKLSCGHIFCEECISIWLDSEHTCPMCRATVAQEDNMWKSGETTYSPQLC
ncbi:unnamed protein product [Thelazia callipaeda]|uniref:RING-type domain-containing protein n=1 Tax=Thelazia callipaeda TaxID=103827 RepID=A0A0N5CQB6_THECL|nr:unnamed protein product [Thelazia callipaeda]